MEKSSETITQNPFSSFNASLMNDEDIIKFWCQPHILFGKQAYGIDLTGVIPVILMGGRGTGKTMLLRYMSNELQIKDHISKNNDPKLFLSKIKYLAVYHRFDGPSLASFTNRGVIDVAWETIFKHYFELVIGQKYVSMLFNLKRDGCLILDIEKEKEIALKILGLLDPELKVEKNEYSLDFIFNLIQKKIRTVFVYINRSAFSRDVAFSDFILSSGDLIFGIPKILEEMVSEIKGKNIILLLDEYENLRGEQQKIVNTLIKHTKIPVSFRIGTRINGFKTYDTLNEGEFLMVDADYRLIQFEDILLSKDKQFRKLLKTIADKRLAQIPILKEKNVISIEKILGKIKPEEEALLVVFGKEIKLEEIEKYPLEKYIKESKHINEINKILEKKYPTQREEYLLKIIYPKNPLMEMLNLLLLRRDYEITNLTQLFESYKKLDNKNINFKTYIDLYNKNKFGLLYQLISLNKPKQKLYAGFDVYCMLSSGIMRNFLELCYQSFNIALFAENDELFNQNKISYLAQTEGSKERAERFFEETIERIPEYGNEIKSLVRCIGQIYYAWQMHERLSEPELTYFCVDYTSLSEKGKNILDCAVKWSVLQKKKPMKGKNPWDPLLDVYALNRILAPFFSISYRLRGRIGRFSKKDIEVMMYGEEEEKSHVISRFIREPTNEEKPTLLDFIRSD
jgi:hypothetical protein